MKFNAGFATLVMVLVAAPLWSQQFSEIDELSHLNPPDTASLVAWAVDHPLPVLKGRAPGAADSLFVFLAAPSEADTVWLRSTSQNRDYPLQKLGATKLWSTVLKLDDPEAFEYVFVLVKDGTSVVRIDPANPFVRYEGKLSSKIRRPGTPLGATVYLPRFKTANPFQKFAPRDLLVSLPAGYFQSSEQRYPVLYMHDGQQVLDSPKAAQGGWKIDSIAGHLAEQGVITAPIIVGVFNSSHRDDEMMGWSRYHQADRAKAGAKSEEVFGWAQAYDYFIVKEVKPMIDARFRTLPDRDHTAVGGASSGAMVALYQLFVHPDVFSRAAALSGGFQYYDDLRTDFFPNRSDSLIYLDCGDQDLDAELLPATKTMDSFLRGHGYKSGQNYLYQELAGQGHGERFWTQRVGDFLKLFFPKVK